MLQSENINDLMSALVCAQAEFPTMPKNKDGYNYKYTDLDTIVQTIKPIMKKYNLAFLQSVGGLDSVTITTRIFHTSGQYIEDTVSLPTIQSNKMNNAQVLGAVITYMRRYTLCALLGITCDEDVDCFVQTAANASKPKASPAPFAPKGGETTQAEKDRLNALCHAKYANGQNVFSVDEINTYLGYRKDKTAAELIQFIENALKNRMPDSELIK
jgi:glutamine synthetase type III